MVDSGGDAKLLGLESKYKMPELTIPDASALSDLNERRILGSSKNFFTKKTNTDEFILNNFHCCHLNTKDKKIYLYTATTTDTIPFSNYRLDYSQTFWAQSEWAQYYKAMIIPPY